MAHECPRCGQTCHCGGDIEDIDWGVIPDCICCVGKEDADDTDEEEQDICPDCGAPTYLEEHTPASDHPELTVMRRECTKCDWHADDYKPKGTT